MRGSTVGWFPRRDGPIAAGEEGETESSEGHGGIGGQAGGVGETEERRAGERAGPIERCRSGSGEPSLKNQVTHDDDAGHDAAELWDVACLMPADDNDGIYLDLDYDISTCTYSSLIGLQLQDMYMDIHAEHVFESKDYHLSPLYLPIFSQ